MIRQLLYKDLTLAAEVIRLSFGTVAKEFGITEQNCPNHTSFTTTEKLQIHFDKNWLMYGLFDDKHLVGYVSLSKESDNFFELHNLAVLPEYRHNGYGKKLLDLCKEKVKEIKGNKITLSIIEENTVLKNWYIKNGFVHTGTKNFDHLPFTCGYMEWEG